MIAKIKIKLAVVTLLGLFLIGTLGTGMAAANNGGGSVGGGLWYWGNIPHTMARSDYFHGSKYHSATAIVGGSTDKKYKVSGEWAMAFAVGWGTTYVYWNTY